MKHHTNGKDCRWLITLHSVNPRTQSLFKDTGPGQKARLVVSPVVCGILNALSPHALPGQGAHPLGQPIQDPISPKATPHSRFPCPRPLQLEVSRGLSTLAQKDATWGLPGWFFLSLPLFFLPQPFLPRPLCPLAIPSSEPHCPDPL